MKLSLKVQGYVPLFEKGKSKVYPISTRLHFNVNNFVK